jgi:hypothetical protein
MSLKNRYNLAYDTKLGNHTLVVLRRYNYHKLLVQKNYSLYIIMVVVKLSSN